MMQLTRSSSPITGLPRLAICAVFGFLGGAVVAGSWNPLPVHLRTHLMPAAYQFSKVPGGTSLRMAMVHDVLHERYLRHGPAWYAKRNESARAIIAAQPLAGPASDALLDAMDDLAVGLDRMGNDAEAAAIERKKLSLLTSPALPEPPPRPSATDVGVRDSDEVEQKEYARILAAQHLSPFQRQQYAACANLGTVLVHGSMHAALNGDKTARANVEEGLLWVRRAVAINPGAHFGREMWQAIAIEHLLAAIDQPDLLRKYDLIGDDLNAPGIQNENIMSYRLSRLTNPDPMNPSDEMRLRVRSYIPTAGINMDWATIVHPEYASPMPFDEPTLGILGMWTLGGGPSPHFALALGRLMQNVGQNEVAWDGYERAVELQESFWPDEKIRDAMVAWCRAEQNSIAERESPGHADAWQAKMRDRHAAELAWGVAQQSAYHDYEAAKIAAGTPLDDPHFYDGFFNGRPSIASSPGLADDFLMTDLEAKSLVDYLPCSLLGMAALMALAMVTDGKSKRAAGVS